jgi:hypothetical protein
MQLSSYLNMVHRAESELAEALLDVAKHHRDEPDVYEACKLLAKWSQAHVEKLGPFRTRYGEEAESEPKKLHHSLFKGPRSGGIGLLRDLHDLYLMATETHLSWTVLGMASMGLKDKPLELACAELGQETERQMAWLLTRMKQAAPMALIAQ